MNEVSYILFGWLLGMLGPTLTDALKARRKRRDFLRALNCELSDIQVRLLITGFLLGQRFGQLDEEYLVWLQAALNRYTGDEEITRIRRFVESLVEDGVDPGVREYLRQEKEGVGLSMKAYSTSYLDSNLSEISGLSADLQARIHEFRNRLYALNQEIILANERQTMTWDSSLSSASLDRLKLDVENRFAFLQNMSVQASKAIESIEALID